MTKTNQTQTPKDLQLFDVIVGNPPYGAKLSKKEQEYLLKAYQAGSTETVILFIKKSLSLLKNRGYLGFIIPKSFCFASNYASLREEIWDNVTQIVDCGKVWQEVKLEQIILILQKGVKHTFYENKIRNGEKFEMVGRIEKETAKEFGFFLNGVSEEDVKKAKIIKQNSVMLNDIAENKRGAMLQKFISSEGDLEVFGGAEISRDGVKGIKGKIKKEYVNDEKAYIKENSVLVQNIVAHIENPEPHIKITACLPNSSQLIVDTINQISIQENYRKEFIFAVLNSNILNWYAYVFIFGKAIRTMHFDSGVTSRLPIPTVTPAEQAQIAGLVDEIMELKKDLKNYIQNTFTLWNDEFGQNIKINKKLENFHTLTFEEFLNELKKQKINLRVFL